MQPSRHEGFGLVVREALTLGKKVVATDFAGANEQIIDSVNGYIARDFTPESITQQIIIALNGNQIKRTNINKEDWEKIENVFID